MAPTAADNESGMTETEGVMQEESSNRNSVSRALLRLAVFSVSAARRPSLPETDQISVGASLTADAQVWYGR